MTTPRAYCDGMDDEQAFPVIRQTVLDTTDPRRLAECYRQLFGLRTTRATSRRPWPARPERAGLADIDEPGRRRGAGVPEGRGAARATWPDGPVPQQLHLDTTVPTVADLDVAHERRSHSAPS